MLQTGESLAISYQHAIKIVYVSLLSVSNLVSNLSGPEHGAEDVPHSSDHGFNRHQQPLYRNRESSLSHRWNKWNRFDDSTGNFISQLSIN